MRGEWLGAGRDHRKRQWGRGVRTWRGRLVVVGAVPTTRPATGVVRSTERCRLATARALGGPVKLYLIVKRVLLLKRRQETNVCSIISHPFPEAVQFFFFFWYRYSFDVTPTCICLQRMPYRHRAVQRIIATVSRAPRHASRNQSF